MKKSTLLIAILSIMLSISHAQLFDSLTVVHPDYDVQDIVSKGDLLFAALGEGGVMVSNDDGFTWNATTTLPDAGFGQEAAYSLFVASNDDLIVGGNVQYNGSPLGGVVFRSSDNGTSWSVQPYEGLGGYEQSGKIIELSGGNLMMKGGIGKLFVSTLSNNEWTQIVAPGGVIFGFEQINDVVFVVTNPSTGTAGTWLSSDLGANWELVGGNGTPVSGGTVTVAPVIHTTDYKFVCIGGSYGLKGVFRAGINDTLWMEKNNGIDNFGVYPICMATDNATIWMVFQDAGGGCYFTSTADFANNWETPVMGMPQQGVGGPCLKKMMVFKTHLYTFANKSIYRLEGVAVPLSINKNKTLAENVDVYPNPVSGQLNIKFKTSGSNCTWEIINIFGQVLENGQLTSNNENVNVVSVDNLPAGYYFLKTNIDGTISINKFLKK